MTHRIPFHFPQGAPLPIPHFFGFPNLNPPKTYDIIIPKDFLFSEGDTVIMCHDPGSAYSKNLSVGKIVERRPARGDWSKQSVHTSNHYVRFISKE